MAKCKCGNKSKIVSNVVSCLNQGAHSCQNGCCVCTDEKGCQDVCANPICGEPNQLGLMAPVIYDEIGVNLCATFNLGTDIPTTYPSVTSASVSAINVTYTNATGAVEAEAIPGRPNCQAVTLRDLEVQFVVKLYDDSCRLVTTLFPTAVYLPTDETEPTYNEDTNPSSVEMDIFAPYGVAYTIPETGIPSPSIGYMGMATTNHTVQQGINFFTFAKLLDFNITESNVTVGLTVVVASMYFAGYRVPNSGRIAIPKGSIISPENSDCLRFVAGDLLNLAIKPLDLSGVVAKEMDSSTSVVASSDDVNS